MFGFVLDVIAGTIGGVFAEYIKLRQACRVSFRKAVAKATDKQNNFYVNPDMFNDLITFDHRGRR